MYPELFIKSADTVIRTSVMENYLFYVGIFSPSGEPILPNLLCYSTIAVDDHSFMCCASYLRQPRLVNNPCTLGYS
jgi:hypothetical protein